MEVSPCPQSLRGEDEGFGVPLIKKKLESKLSRIFNRLTRGFFFVGIFHNYPWGSTPSHFTGENGPLSRIRKCQTRKRVSDATATQSGGTLRFRRGCSTSPRAVVIEARAKFRRAETLGSPTTPSATTLQVETATGPFSEPWRPLNPSSYFGSSSQHPGPTVG